MSERIEEIKQALRDYGQLGAAAAEELIGEIERLTTEVAELKEDKAIRQAVLEGYRQRIDQLMPSNRQLTAEVMDLKFELNVAKEREEIDNTESRLANERIKDLEACLEMSLCEWRATIKASGRSPNSATEGAFGVAESVLKRNPNHAEWGTHDPVSGTQKPNYKDVRGILKPGERVDSKQTPITSHPFVWDRDNSDICAACGESISDHVLAEAPADQRQKPCDHESIHDRAVRLRQDPSPPEYLSCQRCGEILDYESLAGITRWNGFKDWCTWIFLRSWLPEKCAECGKRYGDHPDCLPF